MSQEKEKQRKDHCQEEEECSEGMPFKEEMPGREIHCVPCAEEEKFQGTPKREREQNLSVSVHSVFFSVWTNRRE